jgi:hypothetical protein
MGFLWVLLCYGVLVGAIVLWVSFFFFFPACYTQNLTDTEWRPKGTFLPPSHLVIKTRRVRCKQKIYNNCFRAPKKKPFDLRCRIVSSFSKQCEQLFVGVCTAMDISLRTYPSSLKQHLKIKPNHKTVQKKQHYQPKPPPPSNPLVTSPTTTPTNTTLQPLNTLHKSPRSRSVLRPIASRLRPLLPIETAKRIRILRLNLVVKRRRIHRKFLVPVRRVENAHLPQLHGFRLVRAAENVRAESIARRHMSRTVLGGGGRVREVVFRLSVAGGGAETWVYGAGL